MSPLKPFVFFVLNIHTRWQNKEDDDRCIAWAREFHDATEKFARGVYVNFLSDEGETRVKDAYTEEVWQHLIVVLCAWKSSSAVMILSPRRHTCTVGWSSCKRFGIGWLSSFPAFFKPVV
jgi:hypothetical protein